MKVKVLEKKWISTYKGIPDFSRFKYAIKRRKADYIEIITCFYHFERTKKKFERVRIVLHIEQTFRLRNFIKEILDNY